MRPLKIDFRFLFYTPKNIHLKKKYKNLFNANLLEKYLPFNLTIQIQLYTLLINIIMLDYVFIL